VDSIQDALFFQSYGEGGAEPELEQHPSTAAAASLEPEANTVIPEGILFAFLLMRFLLSPIFRVFPFEQVWDHAKTRPHGVLILYPTLVRSWVL
jgi:hypothetical protein